METKMNTKGKSELAVKGYTANQSVAIRDGLLDESLFLE
jgi:hypothetical protein